MKILVACECSGRVRDAFIAKGHEAMSCDILPSETGGPHHQGDVLPLLSGNWDMLIAFPPCTHIACSGAAWFDAKRADGRQQSGIDFFMAMINAPINKIAVENPVGIMSSEYRKPDQVIQPYYFGDEYQKTTCLWLKNLPPLDHWAIDNLFGPATHVGRGEMVTYASGKTMPKWYAELRGDGGNRSRTFPGIANAMATQWG
jgi:hypothetical protein